LSLCLGKRLGHDNLSNAGAFLCAGKLCAKSKQIVFIGDDGSAINRRKAANQGL
jgi:hypothetical protein